MKQKRGFAGMSPEKRRRIARQGGKAVQQKGTGYKWTAEQAKEAGSKGGKMSQENGTANRFDSESGRAAAAKRKNQRGGTSHDGE